MIGGKASAAPVRVRNYSPSEFSAALAECGVSLCVRNVTERCNLPLGDPRRIATLAAFPGRHFIPESELFRLLGIQEVAS